MVVSLDEDLPQNRLSDWVVLRVELVKAVERVAILKGTKAINLIYSSALRAAGAFLTACMSRVSTLRSKAVRFMLSNTSLRV